VPDTNSIGIQPALVRPVKIEYYEPQIRRHHRSFPRIGRAVTLRLAKSGVSSVITHNPLAAEDGEVVEQVKALGACNLTVPLDVAALDSYMNFAAVAQAVLKKLGATKFDFFVKHAGIGLSQPFVETTEARFDEMTNIHFKSVFVLSQTLLPLISDGG
jgi:NAD(P)-dependent dehydrogenase (short-subunit alcohol dehydrogenase family)